MCSENQGASGTPNGICSNCGSETVDGESVEVCAWSAKNCEECGCTPCDGAC